MSAPSGVAAPSRRAGRRCAAPQLRRGRRGAELQGELAAEVGERQRDRVQRAPGAPAVAALAGATRRGAAAAAAAGAGPPAAASCGTARSAGGEQRLQRVAAARGRLLGEHRVAGVGHHQQVRAGDLAPPLRARWRSGVRRSSAPLRISVGTSGSGASSRRRRGGRVRPVRARGHVADRRSRRRRERGEGARRQRGAAARLRRAAAPGWRCGSMGRPALRRSWRSTAAVEVFAFAFAFAALRARQQARQRRAVAGGGGRTAVTNSARSSGEKSPASSSSNELVRGQRQRPRVPCAVDRATAQRARGRIARDTRARSATGLRVMSAHAPTAHSCRSTRGIAANVGAVERFGPVRRDDRVEHQRFDMAGVCLRVLLGDLRAVAGAVQHELFVAAGLADRLDVGDRVGGRVEACALGPS